MLFEVFKALGKAFGKNGGVLAVQGI